MKKILIFLAFGLLIASCGRKPINSTTNTAIITKTKDSIAVQYKDSIVFKEISLAVYDTIIIPVEKYYSNDAKFDNEVNKRVTSIIKQLQTSKVSGNISYKISYNEATQSLQIATKINEQTNEKQSQTRTDNSKVLTDLNKIVVKEKLVTKFQKYTPKWIKILAFIGSFFILFYAFKIYKNAFA